jgi:hypothetical protein
VSRCTGRGTDGGTLGERTFVLCAECRGTDGLRAGASKGQARGKHGASNQGKQGASTDLCAERQQADSNNSDENLGSWRFSCRNVRASC